MLRPVRSSIECRRLSSRHARSTSPSSTRAGMVDMPSVASMRSAAVAGGHLESAPYSKVQTSNADPEYHVVTAWHGPVRGGSWTRMPELDMGQEGLLEKEVKDCPAFSRATLSTAYCSPSFSSLFVYVQGMSFTNPLRVGARRPYLSRAGECARALARRPGCVQRSYARRSSRSTCQSAAPCFAPSCGGSPDFFALLLVRCSDGLESARSPYSETSSPTRAPRSRARTAHHSSAA
jgi:hypothetical protein